jgi:hypothetical protein
MTTLTTKPDAKKLDSSLELTLAETKAELIRWIVGMGLLQTTIIAGLILRFAGKI